MKPKTLSHFPRVGEAWHVVIDLFPPRERRRLVVVGAAATVVALLDVVGVASIMPFMAVAARPELITTSAKFRALSTAIGVADQRSLVIILGAATLLLTIVSNASTAALTWALQMVTTSTSRRISTSLMGRYLAQPYSYHLKRHSASLIKTLHDDVPSAVQNALLPLLRLITRSLSVIALLTVLALVNLRVSIIVMGVLGLPYLGIFLSIRRLQRRLAKRRRDATAISFSASSEAFGGIKDLKVLGRERNALERYSQAAAVIERAKGLHAALASVPRNIMEAVGLGGVVAAVLIAILRHESMADVLPPLTFFAIAGVRLLPALQEIFANTMALRFNWPQLQRVHDDLMEVEIGPSLLTPSGAVAPARQVPAVPFRRDVRFDDVSFAFGSEQADVLSHMSFRIGRNECVGIIGSTGAGKTTLADLFLGLLEPTDGRILIDDTPLDAANRSGWSRHVGYVPQTIFLSDASLRENIAFGVPASEIDDAAVEHAARLAHIHEFIAGLPTGFETRAGERGVRLSGGQRQRIGIARALYHDPDVLVFDEATSALDGSTEEVVMEAIRSLANQKTMVIIAHRLQTVRQCDRILVIERGKLVDEGVFDDLAQRSELFRHIAANMVTAARS